MLRRRPGGLPYPLGAQAPSITPWTSEARVPLVMGTPQGERRALLDYIPNLLVTTLFAVAMFPPGQQVSASAPPLKSPVQCEPQPRNLALGINPNPAVRQQYDSAPPPKSAIQCEPQHNRLTLGINPNPAVRQLFDSAPAAKYQVQLDQPLIHPETLGINPNPLPVQGWASAPPLKYQVQLDQSLETPLPLGINPNPASQRGDSSAPAPKSFNLAQLFPNLSTTTLALVAGQAPFVPLQSAQWQGKYAVYSEVLPNRVLYAPAVVPVVPALPVEVPAGRRMRHPPLYFVTIDGQRFECANLAAALDLLTQAKATAEALARQKTREALEQPQQPIDWPPFPQISVSSRDLRHAVTETKRDIREVYDRTRIDTEIAVLLELLKRDQDDEDALTLLL